MTRHGWRTIPSDATLVDCVIREITPENFYHEPVDSTLATAFKISLRQKNSRVISSIVLDPSEIKELQEKYRAPTISKLVGKHVKGAYIHDMLYGLLP